jgi:hypothetical protein
MKFDDDAAALVEEPLVAEPPDVPTVAPDPDPVSMRAFVKV